MGRADLRVFFSKKPVEIAESGTGTQVAWARTRHYRPKIRDCYCWPNPLVKLVINNRRTAHLIICGRFCCRWSVGRVIERQSQGPVPLFTGF